MSNYRIELINSYLDKLSLDKKIYKYFYGRNILVTGGAGAIGSNLVITLSKLIGKNGKIIILDNLSAINGKSPIDFPSFDNLAAFSKTGIALSIS